MRRITGALLFLTAACQGEQSPEEPQGGSTASASTSPPALAAKLDEDFKFAVSDMSMEPQFVLVTITDGNTGAIKSGCVSSNDLRGAIHREHEIGYEDQSFETVGRLALAEPLRHFTFKNNEALANLDFAKLETANKEECALVRKGIRVWRTDTGTIRTDKESPPSG